MEEDVKENVEVEVGALAVVDAEPIEVVVLPNALGVVVELEVAVDVVEGIIEALDDDEVDVVVVIKGALDVDVVAVVVEVVGMDHVLATII